MAYGVSEFHELIKSELNLKSREIQIHWIIYAMLCYAKANVISTNLRYQLYNLQLKSTFYIVNLATLSLFKV